ncbi:MAG: HD domain-containing protein [Fibrobacter sp.]|nr:HD domain-containing protein [Fibrobacter sp.]
MSQIDYSTPLSSLPLNGMEKKAEVFSGKEKWFKLWETLSKRPIVLTLVLLLAYRIIMVLVGVYTGDPITFVPTTEKDILVTGVLGLITLPMLWVWMLLTQKAIDSMNHRNSFVQEVTVLGYAKISEARDAATGEHLNRMGRYAGIIAQYLAKNPKYSSYVSPQYVQDILVAAPLHDVGKVGTSDAILSKKGPLTSEEFELMKMHTIIGGDLMAELERKIPYTTFYSLGREIAYHHHQRWDGTGYPNVLKVGGETVFFVQPGVGKPLRGEEIPLCARIVSLADVYDALRSRRCYKEPFSHETAKDIILQDRGKHFDPDVVDAFLAAESMILKVSKAFKDAGMRT